MVTIPQMKVRVSRLHADISDLKVVLGRAGGSGNLEAIQELRAACASLLEILKHLQQTDGMMVRPAGDVRTAQPPDWLARTHRQTNRY